MHFEHAAEEVRRWRTNPNSERYRIMTADEYAIVKRAVTDWQGNASA